MKLWHCEYKAATEANGARKVEDATHVAGPLSYDDLRGQAYLIAHNGTAAAAEFQKVLDHPGIVLNFVTGALAHLGLARAYVLQGDTAKARVAYDDFLMLWKDADPDIRIIKKAANLRVGSGKSPTGRVASSTNFGSDRVNQA